MRRYHHPKKFIILFFTAAAIALSVPILRANAGRLLPLLQGAGERLALISAFTEMPARSKELLEQRFNDELFYPDEPDTTPLPNPEPKAESSSSSPESSSQEETSSSSAAPQAPPSESSSVPEVPEETAVKPDPPEIPKEYQGPMLEEDLSGYDSSSYLKLNPGYLRNYTNYSFDEIGKIAETPPDISLKGNGDPQVLIYHTHATEAFELYDREIYDTRNNWRSTDNNRNMVAVGDALAETLRENGISVIHDTTQHDYPSYNGSYDRSNETISKILEQYPSIQVTLDVHRDAIDRNGTLVRPVTTIDGKKAAQLMIIAPCDDGTMDFPNWRENLRFAAAIQRQAEADFPHLMRPVFFCYRKYNLNRTNGSLLLEFGSHGNTLEECIQTARLAGQSIAKVLHTLEGNGESAG